MFPLGLFAMAVIFDVADLYERVPVGTKVIIRQKPEL